MLADSWTNEYVTELERHIVGLRAAQLPAQLTQTLGQEAGDAYLLKTAAGRHWGTLRGPGSAVATWETYVKQQYPNDWNEIIGLVQQFAAGVRLSSWSRIVVLFKEFLVRQRTAPTHNEYFWRNARDLPISGQQAVSDMNLIRDELLPRGNSAPQDLPTRERNLRNAVVTWHAFTQEVLRWTDFPGNDQLNKTITVVRTESTEAVRNFQRVDGAALTQNEIEAPLSVKDTPLTCVRGPLESSSLYTVKTIYGNVVTEAVVPYHRVFALYLTGRPGSPEHQMSFFENDTENEVSFMPQGLTFQIKDQSDLAYARPANADYDSLRRMN
ncbi:hypothetical protein [Micromonospora sp. NPDC005189]|uniref:hypothetical protein n=1 Tax=unclassified Micromonospora TaxID=2617518 RepID=UPI0033B8DC14